MSYYTIRASIIVGTHVLNWEGESLGRISDIMINKLHGDVAYLVLSYPDTWGPDYLKKRFAVPFDAIAMKEIADGVDYILNVDETFLRRAPGFEDDAWPDFADEQFRSILKDYYKDVSLDIRV